MPAGFFCLESAYCTVLGTSENLNFAIGLKMVILYIQKGSATFIIVTLQMFPFKILKGGVKHQQAFVRRSEYLQ